MAARRPEIDSRPYRAWYDSPLGSAADADEKAAVFALADLWAGERILDLGCGDGNYTAEIAMLAGLAVGVDRSAAMLTTARSRLGASSTSRLIRADGAALPFADRTFDAVIAVTVLCLAHDPAAIVTEEHRVRRPGGRLVLGELARWSVWALSGGSVRPCARPCSPAPTSTRAAS